MPISSAMPMIGGSTVSQQAAPVEGQPVGAAAPAARLGGRSARLGLDEFGSGSRGLRLAGSPAAVNETRH